MVSNQHNIRLGDLLIEKGYINRTQLQEAIRLQKERRAKDLVAGVVDNKRHALGALLVELGYVSN